MSQPQHAQQQVTITATNLSKRFKMYDRPSGRLVEWLSGGRAKCHQDFWALRDFSAEVRRGECLGIIGHNGAGKSTLLKLLTATLVPSEGSFRIDGTVLSLLELGTGFHRELTGRQNIIETASLLGFPPAYARQRMGDIEAFAELGEFFDRPLKIYSSGMMVRLAFSLFMYLEPDVLIIDEALSVGDASFQRKCYRRMEQMISNENRTVILASHDTQSIVKFCTKVIWLDQGRMRMSGEPSDVVEAYLRHMLTHTPAPTEVSESAPSSSVPPNASGGRGVPETGLMARSEAAVLYPNDGAELAGVWLEDSVGRIVTSVAVNSAFRICYAVRFHRDQESVIFGLRLSTLRGDWILGTNTRMHGVVAPSYRAGEIEIVRWPILPGLGSGEHFISCGCSLADEAHHFLLREVDAYQLSITGKSPSEGLCSIARTPILASSGPSPL